MLPFRRSMVPVEGVAIHVMESGPPDARPVLLLHGNPTWGFLWRKVAAALSAEPLRLVMPDLPGLGLSDRVPARAHTLEAHARWMRGVVDALGLERLVFVGQDWGGPIGLRMLADHPIAEALVILNTVVGPPRPGFRSHPFHKVSRVPVLSDLLFRGLGFPQIGLHLAQGDRSSIRGEVARAYRWPLRGLRRNAAPLALARMVPDRQDHPSIAELARCQEYVTGFQGPIAVVWGDRDPVLGRVIRHLERLLPHAPVVHTEAGHFLQEEVPDVIAAAIRRVAAEPP